MSNNCNYIKPLCSPLLCVTYLQTSNLKQYHSKLLKTLIKVTQRGGEHGGESRQSHGDAEGTKSDRAVVCVLLITLVINILRNLANHCFVMK